MSFKDILKQDIKNTFINTEEFGDFYIFNDRKIPCVVDEDKFQEKLEKNQMLMDIEGIIQKGMTVYMSKEHLPVRPHSGEIIEFNGQEYTVASCKEDLGIIELDIYQYNYAGVYE